MLAGVANNEAPIEVIKPQLLKGKKLNELTAPEKKKFSLDLLMNRYRHDVLERLEDRNCESIPGDLSQVRLEDIEQESVYNLLTNNSEEDAPANLNRLRRNTYESDSNYSLQFYKQPPELLQIPQSV